MPQPQGLTELCSNFIYIAVLEHWLIFIRVILILDARVCVQYGVPGRYTDAVFELLVREQSVIWTNPSTCT